MTARFVCTVLLLVGCDTKIHVLSTNDAGPQGATSMDGGPSDGGAPDVSTSDASTPDASTPDAGPPGVGGCYGTAQYGSLLYSDVIPPDGNGVEVWEGCDGAPIILSGPGLPHYPPGPAAHFRSNLEMLGATLTFGPCCPSAGAASGTCLIWPADSSDRGAFDAGVYALFAHDMWLYSSSFEAANSVYPYCMPIRRP